MIYLHYSNRLEELVPPLARILGAQQRQNPLRRAVIVVPNRIVEEYLKLRLAQLSGVAANIEFPFLRRYLARVVAAADPSAALLEADELELVIFECLRRGVERGEENLGAVADYASAGSQRAADRELRLFELSVRTAHLFREYSISRAAMLAQWRNGTAPGLAAMRETERWQRHLYLSIFGPDGRVLPTWITSEKARYFMLLSALASIAPDQIRAALVNPLHVFALSYAGPEFVSAFARLGQMTELHIYALNPCMEFWEDVDNSYKGARDLLVRRGQKVGAALEAADDPFGLDGADDNRALRMWGKPGREYIRLLNELTECDFDPHFKHPVGGASSPSLLAQIQEDILCRNPDTSTPPSKPGRDGSISFLGCPGIRREVEIVADSLWSLIRDDQEIGKKTNGAPPLRFHEIALMIPDTQLDAYLPHVETVFDRRFRIPVNMVDRPFGGEARVIEAVKLLLELPLGRFNRDAVLHLVTHPAVVGDAAVDTEKWEQWCRATGVFFGADKSELDDTYIPANHFHWDQALRRLALGVFMDCEPGGPMRTVTGLEGGEYLPCEIAQDDLASAGTLIATVRRLLADALDLRSRQLLMSVWASVLSDLVKAYLNPAEAEDRAVADYCAAAIESMGPDELCEGPVSYQVACARALGRVREAQAEQGRYAESGVAVGSFSALRSIPFRAIFALGLGEKIFPQRDRRDLLDLRIASRSAGDVSPNQRDRYLFLETLLAARERLILSWVSRDSLTGQTLQPSPLIGELKLIIRDHLGQELTDQMTTTHPASSYDLRYFPDLSPKAAEPGLVNFDSNAREAARMAALRDYLNQSCGVLPREQPLLEILSPQVLAGLRPALHLVDPPIAAAPGIEATREINLSLTALRRYLECPLQGAAQYALGMLDDDEAGDEDPENEPLDQAQLDRVVLLRDAFWEGRGEIHQGCKHFDNMLKLHQHEGRAPVGPFADAISVAFKRRLELCVGQVRSLEIASLSGWERIRIGGAAEESADADKILPPIVLRVPMRRRGGEIKLRVALRGMVRVSGDRDQSINCIVRETGAMPYHFLTGSLAAIALAAAGATSAESFKVIVVGSPGETGHPEGLCRILKVPSAEQARKYLQQLAEDLFSASNNYFLPIEAITAIIGKKEGNALPDEREIADLIEGIRENDNGFCRSDYGPVRNARTYPAPSASDVIEIIKRRFKPIQSIFKAGKH